MNYVSRRNFLKGSAATVGAAALGLPLLQSHAQGDYTPMYEIEEGASLRLLRWSGFVASDEEFWNMNTERFTELTGVAVDIEYITWEDVRAKAALAASLGSGPDIVMGWYDDPHLYPNKLVDLSDLVEHLSDSYGGLEDVCKPYGYSTELERWIGLPIGAAGACMVYRKSVLDEIGFTSFPEDWAGTLELAKELKAYGMPMGFAFGRAVGDGNGWAHTLLWGFGGKIVDADNSTIAINSPETQEALAFSKELYANLADGVSAWLDGNNNRAYLGGKVGATNNGISIYVAAQKDFPEIAEDTYHANMPIGPVGHPTELFLFTQAFVFNHSPAPNAAKEYLRFMLEGDQAIPWIEGMNGYVTPALKAYKELDVWTRDPKNTPYRDCVARMLPNSHAGVPGPKSAAALSEYVVLDMFADACVRDMSPEAAARRAEGRLKRIFR